MAETAFILCPVKKVLLSYITARCPIKWFTKIKNENKNINTNVITFNNSTTEIKVNYEIVFTSINILKIIKYLSKE